LLYEAEVVDGAGLAEPVAEVIEQRQGLLLGGGGGRVVPVSSCTTPREFRAQAWPGRSPRPRHSARACCRLAAAAG
jgi:hypothetical protein